MSSHSNDRRSRSGAPNRHSDHRSTSRHTSTRPPTPGPPPATPTTPISRQRSQSATANATAPETPVIGPPPPPVLPAASQAAMAFTGFNARWGPDGGMPPSYFGGPGRGMYGFNGYMNPQQQPTQPGYGHPGFGHHGFGYGGPGGVFATPIMTQNGPSMFHNTINPALQTRPMMTPPNRPQYPYPVLDPQAPHTHMTNSTGGVGCEPGYNYFFPPEHTKIHFLKTGATPPWQLPPGTHIEFMAAHVPTNITIAQLMKGFGACNPNPQLNNVWEVLPAGNGKWYKGMQFNGDDKDGCGKTLKAVGWDSTRSGLPGGSPIVYLYVTKD